MDSRDVEEIFKGVLTDESQESQECNVFPMNSVPGQVLSTHNNVPASPSPSQHPGMFLFLLQDLLWGFTF